MSTGTLRILTAVVGAPLVLAATLYGGIAFAALVLVAAAACQIEFYQLTKATDNRLMVGLALLAGALIVAGFLEPLLWVVSALVLILIIVVFPFADKAGGGVHSISALLAGIVYPTTLLATLVGVRLSAHAAAAELTILAVVLVWSSDTFAYYVGKTVGRHQLTEISPKKTWEGSIGGLIGAGVVGAILKLWWFGALLGWLDVALLVVICGGLGQLGDIFESKLKRSAEVKDSGSLLPGHGGMLDRLDAVIVVAPLVYIVFVAGLRYVP
ncbi:MAG: phosphatidate cytidylyltransferase [Rhodothermales bacterium]|nr:phosphatidate cytidylyltransferase [Rhodothermales bacterium]